jgi:hypothetical protein
MSAFLTIAALTAFLAPRNSTETARRGLRDRMVRRILRHYRAASPAVVAAGQTWYRTAQDAAVALDPSNPARAAGVIAALSPRAQWRVNLAWAAAMITAADRGDSVPPAVHTTEMRGQAWRIARGEDAALVLRGPKVSRFYRAIMGDASAVTVDVWAARAAGVSMADGNAVGVRAYRLIESAYVRAAAIVGEDPAALQAIVWVQVRGRAA